MTEHPTFGAALAAAQGEMRNVHASALNPHFRSSYVKLDALRDAVLPVMSRHGIAVVQTLGGSNGSATVATVLYWKDSAIECGSASVTLRGKNPAQEMGSATTYLRRYQLAAVAGVAATDDDDGHAVGYSDPAAPSSWPSTAPSLAELQEAVTDNVKRRGWSRAELDEVVSTSLGGRTTAQVWNDARALVDLVAVLDSE